MPVSHEDPRIHKVGFCKLYGDSIEHYARKYVINIGRKSKSADLDVVIGDNMNISRQHASIVYSFEKKAWELRVHGKNGVTVKETLYTPSSPPVTLQSGDLLQLGDRAFFFLLEKGSRYRHKAAKRQRISIAGVSKPRQQQPTTQIMASFAAPQQPITNSTGVASYPQADPAPITSSHPIPLPLQQPQQPQQQVPLPFLFRHLGGAGIPLAGAASGAPLNAASQPVQQLPNMSAASVALQQMGLQAMLQQQLLSQAQQQVPPQGGGGVQPSPLLQQLMAASAAVSAGHTSGPMPGMASVPQGYNLLNKQAHQQPQQGSVSLPSHPPLTGSQRDQQSNPQPFSIPMQMLQRPAMPQQQTMAASQPASAMLQSLAGQGQPARFPYPAGFPAQLLQGLQQHQHLQEQAQGQGLVAPASTYNVGHGALGAPDVSEQSSDAGQGG